MQAYNEQKQHKFLGASKNNRTKVGMLGRQNAVEEGIYEQDIYTTQTRKPKAGFQQPNCS